MEKHKNKRNQSSNLEVKLLWLRLLACISTISSTEVDDVCASYGASYDLLYDDLLDVFFCVLNRARPVSLSEFKKTIMERGTYRRFYKMSRDFLRAAAI